MVNTTAQTTGNENPRLWLMWMSHAQESSKCNTTDAIWLTVYTTYMIWIKNTQHTSIGRLMLITCLTLSSKEWMYTWRESVFCNSRAFYRGVLSSYRQRIRDLFLQQSCVIYCHGAFGAPLCCNCAGEDNTQVRELPAWITLEKGKKVLNSHFAIACRNRSVVILRCHQHFVVISSLRENNFSEIMETFKAQKCVLSRSI